MPRKTTAAATNSPIEVHTTVTTPQAAATEPKPEDRPDFWSYMASLTPQEWQNHIVYLTRENPRTSINGIGGYLTKLSQAFDIEDIKTAFGGYEFSYIMKKGNSMIYKGTFRVEAPPKYDLARENPNPVAAPAAAAGPLGGDVLKVLEQQNQRLYQVLTTLQDRKDDPAVSGAIDILTTAYKNGLNAVATGKPETQASGLKQIEEVLAIVDRVVSLRGGGNGNNSLTETIKTLTDLGVLSKPKSLKDQLEEVKLLSEMMSGEGNPKDWKAMLARAAVDHMPEILETFRTSTAGTIAARRQPPPAGPAAAAPGQRVPPAARPAAPVHTEPRSAISVTGGLPTVARGTSLGTTAESAAAAPTLEEFAPPAAVPETQEQYDTAMKIQMVNMMRMGASGGSIASFLEDVKPEMAKDLTKYDAATIRTFFLQDPVLRLMAEDPHWDEVLADAKEYLAEPVPVN
jgi:hypothetical protein